MNKFVDTLLNLVSGLGTSQDKNYANQYAFNELDRAQLIKAYRGDWLSRKVVDIPAHDATREWRTWEGDAEQVKAIEAEEARHMLVQKTKNALIYDRLLGGGALVLGVEGAGEWSEPLELNRIKQGALKYIHAVDRTEITAGSIDLDLTSPFYREPEHYQVTSALTGVVQMHPSRVVRSVSFPIPIVEQQQNDGWGDSILQVCDTAMKNAATSAEGISALIQNASVDVIKLPDFMQNVATAEYRTRVLERFQLANTAKSLINALILDKEEEWEKIEVNFSGLPDLIRVFLNIAAGAADIPATRLLGQSPTGLNATGESDIRNYYDNIRANQTNEIGPRLSRVDEVLIRSALGERPEEISYEWVSLWQPTDKEKAEVLASRSQAVTNLWNTGLVPDAALAEGVKGMLIEDGSLPGIESALTEEDADLPENEPTVDNLTVVRGRPVKDAKVAPLYVSRRVMNADEIIEWAKDQGIDNIVPADKMHVTITYSTAPVDWMQLGEAWVNEDGILRIAPGGPRTMEKIGRDGDDLVLMFASSELQWRHERMTEMGASWPWGDYQPHITISYGTEIDAEDVEPYRGEIHLGPEIFEDLDENWKETL